MPLLIVTGYPSSGKSTTSRRISEYVKTRLDQEAEPREVVVVSDSDVLDEDGRNSTYMSISEEKQLRGYLKSEMQHSLDSNKVVILDAAIYIKGFRYELFCICKEAKTQYCIIERLIDPRICWSWNEATQTSDKDTGYTKETFDALIQRYEECDSENRWESPLFKIRNPDDEDMGAIYDVIVKSTPLTQNKCTSLASSTSTVYKHLKD